MVFSLSPYNPIGGGMRAFLLLLFILFFSSCGVEKAFQRPSRDYRFSVDVRQELQGPKRCAESTKLKPKVDFLLVQDSSESFKQIAAEVSSELDNLRDSADDRSD